MRRAKPLILVLAIAGFILASEGAVRALGLVDFPLYDADAELGYIPRANQAGTYLRSREWNFNYLHMGGGDFQPSGSRGVIVIGDSVVLGGNPYSAGERLGPQLAAATGRNVWTVAAGSWAFRNQLAYLKRFPEVLGSDAEIIFVVNSADFDEASSWQCDVTHPRAAPFSALIYLVNKQFLRICDSAAALSLKVPPGDWRVEAPEFLRKRGVVFFLYPSRSELDSPKELAALRRRAEELKQAGAERVYDVSRDSRWSADLYRDSVHPTPRGNRVLARIMAAPDPNLWL